MESIADLRKYAPLILTQTVQNKAMPLGNQTAMTDDERAKLGAVDRRATLEFLCLTRFLNANRCPLRLKTLSNNPRGTAAASAAPR